MNILLVEDDLELGNGVRIALEDQGMCVTWVRRIQEANQALETSVCDLVLLDLGLPDGDGIGLVTRLRRNQDTMPVLILTARDALQDRLGGLDSGADDYMVKPFALAELVSRVRALARRSYGLIGETLVIRNLTLHEATMRVTIDTRPIELSKSEFDLLRILVKRADRVLTRRMLEEQVLPGGLANESNVLDVHISNLRRKIGNGFIRTVRGVGFVIDRTAAEGAPR